mmetsp:Transcript_42942/g.105886  ORF Transcript_42942/g.105886 Transcript_42942/m.105886 type:complete len:222 (+) Transcript_42942:2085-2750(+)
MVRQRMSRHCFDANTLYDRGRCRQLPTRHRHAKEQIQPRADGLLSAVARARTRGVRLGQACAGPLSDSPAGSFGHARARHLLRRTLLRFGRGHKDASRGDQGTGHRTGRAHANSSGTRGLHAAVRTCQRGGGRLHQRREAVGLPRALGRPARDRRPLALHLLRGPAVGRDARPAHARPPPPHRRHAQHRRRRVAARGLAVRRGVRGGDHRSDRVDARAQRR